MDVDPDALVEFSERTTRYVEIVAAYVLVLLFAVGVQQRGCSTCC